MNNAVITIKIDKQTKSQAQKVAQDLGFSLSAIIKAQLRYLVRAKHVHVSLAEKPNSYFVKSLAQSEKDIKEGRVTAFESGKDALFYLEQEIEDEKKGRKNTH
ncbi:MAG TPA: type II toxin-antitoxin system RelB/DinJ family antitoxin [Candidatus Saccharimonadales bacterium]|nr:type II toxin-antitoxin system RelB/DinJ family antitoxin [Candidatus Saccharimonadales bacterium]